MDAVVLFSGGLDSTTALYWALLRFDHVVALHFDYGQRHAEPEQAATNAICNVLQSPSCKYRQHFTYRHLRLPDQLFRSANALTGDVPIPSAAYADLEGVSPTYVPFRNGNLISAAASVAVQMNCSAVVTANHANDWANWAYPDCSPEFIGAMANALWVGTYQQVRLVSPFLHRTKGEIAAVGAVLNVPYELTRSCYTEAELHCGTCPTCRERHEAFAEALYPDPTVYAHQPNGPGCQVSGAPLA